MAFSLQFVLAAQVELVVLVHVPPTEAVFCTRCNTATKHKTYPGGEDLITYRKDAFAGLGLGGIPRKGKVKLGFCGFVCGFSGSFPLIHPEITTGHAVITLEKRSNTDF